VRAARRRATVGDEYIPAPADAAAWFDLADAPTARLRAVASHADVEVDRGTELRVRVDGPAPTAVAFSRWYFPGWRAWVDERAVPPRSDARGELVVDVPAGAHRVALRYRAPAVRRYGLAVSAVAAVLLLAGSLATRRRAPAR
jgi:hypothetical protein